MLGGVLEVLFPRNCVGCRSGAWPLCPSCEAEVGWLDLPGCGRCGRPFEAPVDACADCPPAPVSRARAPFLYAGPVRRALMRLKFRGERSVAAGMAPFITALLVESIPPGDQTAAVTWVPLGPRRRRARSFDQAEALARAAARLAGLPVVRLLDRVIETDPQARRSGAERRRALRGAFQARAPTPSSVVLVDDVLTSGATAAACAEALRGAGATSVTVVTAARSLGGPIPARCYTRSRSGPGLWLPGGGSR